jgi:SAM-dependent methyltransferase
MNEDPTRRFSSRVEDYVRYRPPYPVDVASLLARECGLAPNSRVADIGSGTGLLARLFLDFGCEVFGVEPNPEMRQAGEHALATQPRFHSVDGRAEATTLPAQSIDFVTAGQSFHWFEADPARAEFRRILSPGGWVVLVWNERLPGAGFMDGYESLVTRYGRECPRAARHGLDAFFENTGWRFAQLPNQQVLSLEGLRGRFLSSSRAPLPDTPDYQPLMEELRELFERYQAEGRVTLLYQTEIYFGRLP